MLGRDECSDGGGSGGLGACFGERRGAVDDDSWADGGKKSFKCGLFGDIGCVVVGAVNEVPSG